MKENSIYLDALINNNNRVIKTIYSAVLPKVIKFVYQNKGNEDNAREVFQNALLQLTVRYKKEKFVINTSFEAYLFTVCKNLWRRELNRTKKEVTNDGVFELKDNNDDLAYAILEQKQWELFNETLTKLTDNCRSIMALFFKRVSYAEIVKKFDYNSETVARQRIFKCKAKLKALIIKDKRFNELKGL